MVYYTKKLITFFLISACIFGLSACEKNVAGNVENVQIIDYHSEIYTDEEIENALDVTFDYFIKEFSDCTLTEITCIGDSELDLYQDFAETHNAEDVIVFVSTFDVDSSGEDGSLSTNYTYENWKWILVRDNGGAWRHVDHGY